MNGDDPSADFKDSFAMQICVKCSMQKVLHRHSFGFGLGTQQGMIGVIESKCHRGHTVMVSS